MFGTWRYSTDVLNFWSINQDKAETVDILFEMCFSIASKGLFAIENKNFPPIQVTGMQNLFYFKWKTLWFNKCKRMLTEPYKLSLYQFD